MEKATEKAVFKFEEKMDFEFFGDKLSIVINKYGKNEYLANISIYLEKKLVENRRVIFEAEWLRNLAVAGRNINYGEIIETDSVVFEKMDYFLYPDSFSDEDFEYGQMTKYFIREGNVIKSNSLKSAPYVIRGQIIQGMVRIGTVSVSVQVKVLSDGSIGDIVRAMNIESGVIVSGIIEEGPVLNINY